MPQKYFRVMGPVMISIKKSNDNNHPILKGLISIFDKKAMFLSKSFGYALRGILFVATMQDEQRKVQIDEIAKTLAVPKHFLGKIMQQVVKVGFLKSTKGPYGGFSLTDETLNSPLIRLVEITDGMEQFNFCVLKLKYCNGSNPCPLHNEMNEIRTEFLNVFQKTTIGDLLNGDKNDLIKSLAII